MSSAVLLRAARALIADPDYWTTDCAARDVHGQSVMPDAEALGNSVEPELSHPKPEPKKRGRK